MNKKYYVLQEGGRCDGPYTFKEAMSEKAKCDRFSIYSEILKLVVDVEGRIVLDSNRTE